MANDNVVINPSCGQSWKDYVDRDVGSALQSWCDFMTKKNQKKRKYCDDFTFAGKSIRDFLLLNPPESDSSDNEEIESHSVSNILVKANMRSKQVFQPACITSKCELFDFYNHPDPWHWVNQDFDYGHYYNVEDSYAMNWEVEDLEKELLVRVNYVPSLHCHGPGSPRENSFCIKFPELVRKDVVGGGDPFHLVYTADPSKPELVQEKEFMGRPITRQVYYPTARDSDHTHSDSGCHQNVVVFNYASLGWKMRHHMMLKAPFPK